MVEKIQKIVIEYVQKNANMEEWKSIRQCYFWYSYLAFVNLYILKKRYSNPQPAYKELVAKNILDYEALEYFGNINDSDIFFIKIQNEISEDYDLALLYQEYISSDFYVDDSNVFQIKKGKDSRDILGSYYTQDDFSSQIIKKALDAYITFNPISVHSSKSANENIKTALLSLTYIDSSCGAGGFLISIIKYMINHFNLTIKEREIFLNKIYGYDVDPIALFITRIRIMEELNTGFSSKNIQLGNPLIPKEGTNIKAKYILASEGRFYNMGMGISNSNVQYDIIAGNPPWEKIRFEEKKFLAHYVNNPSNLDKKSDRDFFINNIASKENTHFFHTIKNDYLVFKNELKKSKTLELTTCGELNTYALFTEWAIKNISDKGWIALIVKSSLLKAQVYSKFFAKILKEQLLYKAYMFTNRKKIFPIDSREEFSVIFLGKAHKENLKVIMNLETLEKSEKYPELEFSPTILKKVNPITGMIPNVHTNEELNFLLHISTEHNIFHTVYPECKYGRIVHLTNHSPHIAKKEKTGYIPIYEGKFIEQYNNHYATYQNINDVQKYSGKSKAQLLPGKNGTVESRYFIESTFWNRLSKNFEEDFCIAWRSLTSATNTRTMLATILPKMPTCQSIQFLQIPDKKKLLHILAIFNSIIFDYLVRLNMAGLDLTQTIIKQIPVPQESNYQKRILFQEKEETIENHIFTRIKELYKGDTLLKDFFNDITTYKIKEKTDKELVAELDILSSIIYGIHKPEFVRIVKQFKSFYTEKDIEVLFL